MTNWDAIIKQARECHTRISWQVLIDAHGDAIASSASPKPLHELYKHLRNDPNSRQYDPRIWAALLKGSIRSSSLSLATEIAEFAKKISSPLVATATARAYLAIGQPWEAREIANRTLRLTSVLPSEQLQLEMVLAQSYIIEGKWKKSVRLLLKLRSSTPEVSLSPTEQAAFLRDMGELQCRLGRHSLAGDLFYNSFNLFYKVAEWELAAMSLYQAAVCYRQCGIHERDETRRLLEKISKIAETHGLPLALSHCEAAYGIDAFQHGNFSTAVNHFRNAITHNRKPSKSDHTRFVLAMLARSYVAIGSYPLAKKFWQKSLHLEGSDKAGPHQVQYRTLEAELLWEDGAILESQRLLQTTCKSLDTLGARPEEDHAAVHRLALQSAHLGQTQLEQTHIMTSSKFVGQGPHTFLAFQDLLTVGQMALNRNAHSEAVKYFERCINQSQEAAAPYYTALATLGLVQTNLKQRKGREVTPLLRELERQVSQIGETPMKIALSFAKAGQAYQQGAFHDCERILRQAAKISRASFSDKFALNGWLATIEGRSYRLANGWQTQLMARYTKIYFSPTLEAMDRSTFCVSGQYMVSLARYPALSTLLHHLLCKASFSAEAAEIQTQVWKQGIHLQGWQQKIRNTIMRLRDFFPQTMAPLILHGDTIALFKEAIALSRPRQAGLNVTEEISQLLRQQPMSSQQLSKYLKISPATAKRALRKLTEDQAICSQKQGRNVYYQPLFREDSKREQAS